MLFEILANLTESCSTPCRVINPTGEEKSEQMLLRPSIGVVAWAGGERHDHWCCFGGRPKLYFYPSEKVWLKLPEWLINLIRLCSVCAYIQSTSNVCTSKGLRTTQWSEQNYAGPCTFDTVSPIGCWQKLNKLGPIFQRRCCIWRSRQDRIHAEIWLLDCWFYWRHFLARLPTLRAWQMSTSRMLGRSWSVQLTGESSDSLPPHFQGGSLGLSH